MNKLPIGALYVMLVFLLLIASCQHDPVIPEKPDDPGIVNNCHPDTVYFQNEIMPLLLSSCGVAGCHDPATASDGVIIRDYASVMQTAGVRAGRPDKSDLYEAITESDPSKLMPPPPRPRLTDAQILKIRRWIEQGALNNQCESNICDTLVVSFGQQIRPVINSHCLGCHSGASPAGGIALQNHAQVAQVAASGRLLGSLQHQPGFSAMPQGGSKLNDCAILQFKKWIENGTPDN